MPNKKASKTLKDLRNQVIAQGLSSITPFYVDSAKGAIIRDLEGQEYIDFSGGIGAMNIGHSHPKVVAAIKDQADKFTHSCFLVSHYRSAVELAERLCQITPGDFSKKTLFVNSGAEAVENAVKIARYCTKRPAIIVFENAYHGRTLLTMTMTSKVKPYKLGFGPFAPEVYRMPFGDVIGAQSLKDFFTKHVNPEAVAAVVAEVLARDRRDLGVQPVDSDLSCSGCRLVRRHDATPCGEFPARRTGPRRRGRRGWRNSV